MSLLPLFLAALCFSSLFWSASILRWREVFPLWMMGAGLLFLMHWPIAECGHIGHEAVYMMFFEHHETPQAGDTLSYPAVQLLWWLWGVLFFWLDPGTAALLLHALIPSLMAQWVEGKQKYALFLWTLTVPLFFSWSCSLYNVLPPMVMA
ncbi:MAG: hypothetical protein CMK59_06280, partial [Proteobacteria bacterium]|nr:hypothetical protein [Pseudomonadota bacterium]